MARGRSTRAATLIALAVCLLLGRGDRPAPQIGTDSTARRDSVQAQAEEPAPGLPEPATADRRAPPSQAETPAPGYVPNQLLVMFAPGVSVARIEAVAQSIDADLVWHFPGGRLKLLASPDGLSVPRARELLGALPEIELSEPNWLYRASGLPDDPGFERLWGLRNEGQTGGTPGVDIA